MATASGGDHSGSWAPDGTCQVVSRSTHGESRRAHASRDRGGVPRRSRAAPGSPTPRGAPRPPTAAAAASADSARRVRSSGLAHLPRPDHPSCPDIPSCPDHLSNRPPPEPDSPAGSPHSAAPDRSPPPTGLANASKSSTGMSGPPRSRTSGTVAATWTPAEAAVPRTW
ncbi:hypothetical protein ACU686_18665 [Yinghuangia aomiensis]